MAEKITGTRSTDSVAVRSVGDGEISAKHAFSSIFVTGFQATTKPEDLIVHFQDTKNGGGDIDRVITEQGAAVIIFDKPEVAKSVLRQEQEFQGVVLTVKSVLKACKNPFECVISNGVRISLDQNDLTEKRVDAIVIAANAYLVPRGRVAVAIVQKGGSESRKESRQIFLDRGRRFNEGDAVYTTSGKLSRSCEYIIHTVCPMWDSREESKCISLLHRAFMESFHLAGHQLELCSIALPAIGSDYAFSMPIDVCAQVMFDALEEFSTTIDAKCNTLRYVSIAIIDEKTISVYREEFIKRYISQETSSATSSTHQGIPLKENLDDLHSDSFSPHTVEETVIKSSHTLDGSPLKIRQPISEEGFRGDEARAKFDRLPTRKLKKALKVLKERTEVECRSASIKKCVNSGTFTKVESAQTVFQRRSSVSQQSNGGNETFHNGDTARKQQNSSQAQETEAGGSVCLCLEVEPQFMKLFKRVKKSQLQEFEERYGVDIVWSENEKHVQLRPSKISGNPQSYQEGCNLFIDLYKDNLLNTGREEIEMENVIGGRASEEIHSVEAEHDVVIEKVGNKLVVYAELNKIASSVQVLKERLGLQQGGRKTRRSQKSANLGSLEHNETSKLKGDRFSALPVSVLKGLNHQLSNGVNFSLYQGDITDERVDAIVNVANRWLSHGAGVAVAIARKGGRQIEDESRRVMSQRNRRPLDVGDTVHTRGGYLPCPFVIHTVGPRWSSHDKKKSISLLRRACMESLRLAVQLELCSIALPPISSGIFGMPKDICAQVMIRAIEDFSSSTEAEFSTLRDVRIVIIDDETIFFFREEFVKRYTSQETGPTMEPPSNERGVPLKSTAEPPTFPSAEDPLAKQPKMSREDGDSTTKVDPEAENSDKPEGVFDSLKEVSPSNNNIPNTKKASLTTGIKTPDVEAEAKASGTNKEAGLEGPASAKGLELSNKIPAARPSTGRGRGVLAANLSGKKHKQPGSKSIEGTQLQENLPEQVLKHQLSNGVNFSLYQGDITDERVDAIVNVANRWLSHGAGVAAAIARKGGRQIKDESRRVMSQRNRRPLDVGDVVFTRGGNLPCKFLIHAVAIGPRWSDYDMTILCRAYLESLRLAAQLELCSIALPPISSGIFGMPKDICAQVMIQAIEDFSSSTEAEFSTLRDVRIVINEDEDDETISFFREEFVKRYTSQTTSAANVTYSDVAQTCKALDKEKLAHNDSKRELTQNDTVLINTLQTTLCEEQRAKTKMSREEELEERLRNELARWRQALLSEISLRHTSEQKIREKETMKEQLQRTLNEEQQVRSGMEEELKDVRGACNAKEEKLQDKLAQTRKRLDSEERLRSTREEELSRQAKTVEELQPLNEEKQTCTRVEDELRQARSACSELKERLQTAVRLRNVGEQKLREKEATVEGLQKTLREERQAKTRVGDRLRQARSANSELKERLQTAVRLRNVGEQKLREKEATVEGLQKTLREERQAKTRVGDRLRQARSANSELTEIFQSLDDELRLRNVREQQLRENAEKIVEELLKTRIEDELRQELQLKENAMREQHQRLQDEHQQKVALQEQLRNCQTQIEEERDRHATTERELQLAQETLIEHQLYQPRDWTIQREEVILSERVLGTGGWGNVCEGTFRGCQVALKEIHAAIISDHNRRLFEREISMASRCRHPNLLQFIGATNEDGNPLFVTELLDTSLREVLHQRALTQEETVSLALDVAKGLNYLHLNRPLPIIHRDISSANVLLWKRDTRWRAKLSDYGSANFLRQAMTVNAGAVIYSAPEAATSQQSPKLDVYSFGVLLCEMCIREQPDPQEMRRQIRQVTNGTLRGIIQRCVQMDPEARPSISAVIDELQELSSDN